jgi:mRNA-decapping enzyme subunit 2
MTEENPSSDVGTNQSMAFDMYDNISYEDALDDVHTRFILNLPESELRTADRIFVQIEQAWWYYEDFICDPRPHLTYLPRHSHLRSFAKDIFEYSTVLPDASQFNDMWKEYSKYKKKISNYGCILLSADCRRIVLCQIYNAKRYTLPSGKINEGEDGATAAARETYEETGFDPSCLYGITATWKEQCPHRITWDTEFQHPKNKLVHQGDDTSTNTTTTGNTSNSSSSGGGGGGKRRTCYVIVGVPEDFPFTPICRKEVSNIVWFDLDQLSTIPTFAVKPFVKSLRTWIQKYQNKISSSGGGTVAAQEELQPQARRDQSNPKNRSTNNKKGQNKNKTSTPQRNSRTNSRHRDRDVPTIADDSNDTNNIILSGLGKSGDPLRWTEEDMFQANAQILGRNVVSEYDGNPHLFTEEGLSKIDPHSYRIVGGTLLNQHAGSQIIGTTNSTVTNELSRPVAPDPSQLQSLVYNDTLNGDGDFLTPFFSQDGATPWGEVIPGAQQSQPEQLPPPPPSLSTSIEPTKSSQKAKQPRKKKITPTVVDVRNATEEISESIVPTDAQITAKSQATKKISILKKPPHERPTSVSQDVLLYRQRRQEQYESDLLFIQNWVDNLPKPQANSYFGVFTLDADAIMAQAMADINHHTSKQQLPKI